MNYLLNKVAVVTGASSGIGRATEKLFAGEGVKVIVAARRQPELELRVDEIKQAGGEASALAGDDRQQSALRIFQKDWAQFDQIKLHLNGTAFQLKVWEMLLKIPLWQLTTYGTIAEGIERPTAARAVGTAIESNPVAFLIPCHRVIQASGKMGGYMWGKTRLSVGKHQT